MLTPPDRNIRLKQVYSQLDRKFEEEETQKQAATFELPYMSLFGFPIDNNALSIIPKEKAEVVQAIIFYKEGRNLKLGTVGLTPQLLGLVEELKDQSYFTEVYIISKSSLRDALQGYHRIVSVKRRSQDINIDGKDPKFQVGTLKDLAHKLAAVSATEIIELFLGSALNFEASDIHIEPGPAGVKVRYRIDGVLQDIVDLDKELHHTIVSRIKILSKLKLNVVTTPQDGSFSLTFDQFPVDVRVSVLPSAYGESLVLRLLRQDKGSLEFDELGIAGFAREQLLSQLEKPNGMILTTGPTGSGKTTTLYAMLNRLNEPGVKIITIEDPVEYKIPGITQSPIDAAAGLTFASALRAILRQDPDVVMVGEMRDLETAEIACQAALTGHVVLSTLHTNDAAGAIPRLIDLGVKPFVLAPAINAIIAQRLVRRLCEKCKKEYAPEKHLMERAKMILSEIPKTSKLVPPAKLKFYHSPGCTACKGLGYKGRIGVHEIFMIDEAIEKLILKTATTTEIKRQAVASGMITMAQDGVLKALDGITDLEEVFRVTEE
jgi:type II secretory ATPase GspE/PulE/Tfp pilus assembly ATPase PilB-like protein